MSQQENTISNTCPLGMLEIVDMEDVLDVERELKEAREELNILEPNVFNIQQVLYREYKQGILKLNCKEQLIFDAIMIGRIKNKENILDTLYIIKYCTNYDKMEEELAFWK